jgi:hypothetical protein
LKKIDARAADAFEWTKIERAAPIAAPPYYSSSLIARSVLENRDGDDSHRLAEDVGGGEAHRCGASGFHVTAS